MEFLAIARRRTERFSEQEFTALLEPEAERVRELYAAGTLRAAWSRDDVPGAVLLLECAGESDAWAVLATLPLAGRDMLEIQLLPVRGYRGFGPRG